MAKFQILRNKQINRYLPIPADNSISMVERKQTTFLLGFIS